jgi:hypothetical protein
LWRRHMHISSSVTRLPPDHCKSSALNNPQLVETEGFFVVTKHCKMPVPGC